VLGSALDANGNTLSDASGKSYTWDFENRLTQALVPGTDGGTTTFKYDPFGRRIQKSGPLGTTNYLYDGKKLVEEVDQAGNVLARYAQGKRLDEPLAELRQTTTSYYEQDGLGSVTSLSNSAGAVAETYAYDSYGKATASTGTLVNPFQYTGREFDSETGVYYYRARYFDPSAGRFLSQDPIRYGGGVNFYAYTRNNPVARIDPFGYDGTCTNPAYCVPGSATWGAMYLGPDGVWYNDGPPPGPEPPVPDDGPTPPPNPPSPIGSCDHPEDQPQPPPPPPPTPPKRDCASAVGETSIGAVASVGTVAALIYLAPEAGLAEIFAESGLIGGGIESSHVIAAGLMLAAMPFTLLGHGAIRVAVDCFDE
jgi:RHS repeat-associated protein